MYCPECGTLVDEGNSFCPNCGAQIKVSPLATAVAQDDKPVAVARTRPLVGLVLSAVGGAITFLASIVYLVVGNPVAGVLGVLLAIIAVLFARKGYLATDKKKQQLNGVVPMFIGLFLMLAGGTLLAFDFVVIVAGFLAAAGGALVSEGKWAP